MKPSDGRYQTATQVKVLSPVMNNVREVDGFHLPEDSMLYTDKARYVSLSRGLSPWYDIEWKLQELGRPDMFPMKWVSTNDLKRGGCGGDISGVGLTHSRGVVGAMPYEFSSDGHSKGLALVCKGDVKHRLYTEVG
jgi:hypothetical protein